MRNGVLGVAVFVGLTLAATVGSAAVSSPDSTEIVLEHPPLTTTTVVVIPSRQAGYSRHSQIPHQTCDSRGGTPKSLERLIRERRRLERQLEKRETLARFHECELSKFAPPEAPDCSPQTYETDVWPAVSGPTRGPPRA
jgi:hypothetical protein